MHQVTHHARLTPAGHTIRSCPPSAKQYDATRPDTAREDRARRTNPMPPGVMAVAPDTPHVARPFGSRPSNPLYKRGCILSPIRTGRSIADVVTTPADVYDAEHPLTPTWWLVLSARRPSDQISKSLSVLGARGNEQSLRYCWPRRPVSRTCDKDWERPATPRSYLAGTLTGHPTPQLTPQRHSRVPLWVNPSLSNMCSSHHKVSSDARYLWPHAFVPGDVRPRGSIRL